jgi:Fe-S-cluster containining protein
MEGALSNYYAFVAKVDALCQKIESDFSVKISCHEGCSSCCRHITLVWVEAMALAVGFRQLPPDEIESIGLQAESAKPDGRCPLLVNDRCALYEQRPIICRTHGLPILTTEGGEHSVDCCPRNFTGVESLTGDDVIDLERLNTLLDTVNGVFINEFFNTKPEQERLSVAEALLLEIDISADT